jgi:NAD(P)H-flavin reductase
MREHGLGQGGRMSQYLEKMALGDTIDVKGPLGHFIYEGRGYYRSHGTPGFTARMSMIAGGTGITPMFQVIKVRSSIWSTFCVSAHGLAANLVFVSASARAFC